MTKPGALGFNRDQSIFSLPLPSPSFVLFHILFWEEQTDVVITAHTSTYLWVIAGPVSGIIVIAIFIILKVLGAVRDPVLDEEKAKPSRESNEMDRAWWSLLVLRKAKVKNI